MSWANQVAASASNLRRTEGNPTYAGGDFYEIYPQFQNTVPLTVTNGFIELADTSLSQARWRGAWKTAMGLFVAHHCTLWLQTQAVDDSVGSVAAAGQNKGAIASKSVGSVSVTYDNGAVNNDLDGWASWKQTVFGTQLATMAKIYGRGGMGVR